MNYNYFSNEPPAIAKLENDGEKYTKREHYIFNFNGERQTYYDEINLNNNIMTIVTKHNEFPNEIFYKKVLKMSNGRIDQAIVYQNDISSTYQKNDTINYSYQDSKLVYILVKNRGVKFKTNLSYSSYGNLENVSIKFGDWYYGTDGFTHYNFNENSAVRIKRNFSNYDKSENPLKSLMIFDETLYRSLSKNNYRKFEEYRYDENNEIIAYSNKEWILTYDENGNVNFTN